MAGSPTLIGWEAGTAISTGNDNILIGHAAGQSLTPAAAT